MEQYCSTILLMYYKQRSLSLSVCFVFGLQVGKPTAVIRKPYAGKIISV